MDDVARLSASDRLDLFTSVGAQRGNMTKEIIEKDFWVCWSLRRVFSMEDFSADLIFKGGTSLSKCYDSIRRFSEDIDLSINRAAIGFSDDRDPANAPSRKKAEKTLKELTEKCREVIREKFLPKMLGSCEQSLGYYSEDEWQLTLDPEDREQLTVLFRYPSSKPQGKENASAYIRPMVRLEFGARSDHWPSENKVVKSYAAETLPDLFKDAEVGVKVLAAERTFWEKATILHAWYHAPEGKSIPLRQSRHYYDLCEMYRSEVGKGALNNIDLLEEVANHKKLFFASGWANYDKARPGTLCLVPPEFRLQELNRDYQDMQEMFFEDPMSFEELCHQLHEIEQEVNKGSS